MKLWNGITRYRSLDPWLIRTCWPPGGADVDRSTAEGRRLGAAAQHVSRSRQKQGAAQWRSAGRGALPHLCCPGVSHGVSSSECDDWQASKTWQDGTLSIEEIQKGIAESAVEIPQDLIEIMPLGKNSTSLLKSEYEGEKYREKIWENTNIKNFMHFENRVFAWLKRPSGVLPQFSPARVEHVALLFCLWFQREVWASHWPLCAAICSIQYNFIFFADRETGFQFLYCLKSISPGLNIHEFTACRLMFIDLHTRFFMTQHFTEPGSTPNPIPEVEDWLVKGFGWDLKIREICGIIDRLYAPQMCLTLHGKSVADAKGNLSDRAFWRGTCSNSRKCNSEVGAAPHQCSAFFESHQGRAHGRTCVSH